MTEALSLNGSRRRQVQLRDGLLAAILAARAMRLRSVASLTLGDRFRRDGECWMISLDASDIKTGKPIEYRLPEALTPWIERYLTVERLELLAGASSDALWVNWGGAQLGERGLEKRIVWRSAKEFGPHRFRYGVATVGPMEDTAAPGASAAMLGISAGVAADHYDRGKRVAAAKRYHAGLSQERRRTAPLARRLFAQQNGA